jgi:hypothetical protein
LPNHKNRTCNAQWNSLVQSYSQVFPTGYIFRIILTMIHLWRLYFTCDTQIWLLQCIFFLLFQCKNTRC